MNLFQSVTSALDNTLASDPTAGRISLSNHCQYQDYIFVALPVNLKKRSQEKNLKNYADTFSVLMVYFQKHNIHQQHLPITC